MTGYSHKLSNGAIAGIVVASVVVAVLIGALLFLLGRHKTMLQFMRRQYQPPRNQEMGFPQGQSGPYTYHSVSPSAIPYQETPNYYDHIYDSPPYSEHPAHGMPPESVMAELPSPEKEKSQEYIASLELEQVQKAQAPMGDGREVPNQVPSPAPTRQSREPPLSF